MRTPWRYRVSLVCLAIAVASGLAAAAEGRKVIIDTDPGADDAVAILLALNSPELDVKGLTVVAGNVLVEQGASNALRLVSLAGRCEVPVAQGASHPLVKKLVTAEYFNGANGLGNVELPASGCQVDRRLAPDLIIGLLHQFPHQVTLVTIGPLTNLALALRKDPAIATLAKEVVLMGGSIAGGNVTAAAEANISNDPEAARAVFEAGWPLTMVGLNVTERTLFTRADLDRLARSHGPQNDAAVGILNFLVDRATGLGREGTPMHDPLAVGAVIDRHLITTRDMWVEIETAGEFTRGETVASRHNTTEHVALRGDHYAIDGVETLQPNVHVAVESDAPRFKELLISRLAGK